MPRHARQVFADVAEEIVGALNALIFKYGVNCILDLDFIVSTALRAHCFVVPCRVTSELIHQQWGKEADG